MVQTQRSVWIKGGNWLHSDIGSCWKTKASFSFWHNKDLSVSRGKTSVKTGVFVGTVRQLEATTLRKGRWALRPLHTRWIAEKLMKFQMIWLQTCHVTFIRTQSLAFLRIIRHHKMHGEKKCSLHQAMMWWVPAVSKQEKLETKILGSSSRHEKAAGGRISVWSRCIAAAFVRISGYEWGRLSSCWQSWVHFWGREMISVARLTQSSSKLCSIPTSLCIQYIGETSERSNLFQKHKCQKFVLWDDAVGVNGYIKDRRIWKIFLTQHTGVWRPCDCLRDSWTYVKFNASLEKCVC